MDITKKNRIAEALRLAKKNKKKLYTTDVSLEVSSMLRFIFALDIKLGTNPVSANILYRAYKAWVTEDEMAKHTFMTELAHLFQFQIDKARAGRRFYNINYLPMELVRTATKLRGRL